MKSNLFKIIFFPLDLVYLTLDSCSITVKKIETLFKKKKLQRCHFCQGEGSHDEMRPVRSVLKYQNKWMVKLLTDCIIFKSDGKRTIGFCKHEGTHSKPPVGVPLVALVMLFFWFGGSFSILKAFSSDPENFGKNFISTFMPSSLGNDDTVEPDFLGERTSQLNPERAERYYMSGLRFFDQLNYPAAQVDFKIAIQSNPTDPKIHYHLGRSFLAMGQIVQGESSIRKTIELDPENVEALLLLAELMERRENRSEALELAEKALELDPENVQAIRLNAGLAAVMGDKETARLLMDKLVFSAENSADLLTFLGRLELSVFGDVETAKARIEAALKLNEEFVPARLVMISIALQEKNIADIDAAVEKVLELDPDNIQALRIQADMILNRYGMSAGLRAYSQLLNRFGGDMGLRLRYAELLLRAGKISEGKKLAQQLTASRIPQFERGSHWMLAQMYAQVRMHEEAVQHARSTLRLAPNGQSIHLFLAQQFIALGQFSEARREAESALAINRQDLRAINLLTQAMVMAEDTNQAINLLDSLVKEFPEQDGIRMRRIEILMQTDSWKDALADTRMLQEKYPDNAALQNNLAFLLARSGEDLGKANELSLKLAEDFSDNPIIMDTRAYVLASSGQHEEALPIYEKALSMAGDNVVIRYHYAKSLIELGRADDAKNHLQALLMINPSFPQANEARELLTSLTGEA